MTEQKSSRQMEPMLLVVPCLNEARHIANLVTQFLTGDLPDKSLLVVVDGGSTDGTLDIVKTLMQKFENLRLLHNPKKFQSAGVNLAAKTYAGEYKTLLRIDAHAKYAPDYAVRLAQSMAETGAQSVVVPMFSEGFGWFQKAVAAAQNSVLGTGGSPHRHKGKSLWVDHGHHALFDLDWFLKIGGYNEDFSHNEDAEFDIRLHNAGGKVWLDGGVPIVYYPRSTYLSLCRQYFLYGRGRARTVQLHKMKLKPRQLAPIAISPLLIAAVVGIIYPKLWFLAIPTAMWMILSLAFATYLAQKNKSLHTLAAGWAAMAMHLFWSLGYWFAVFFPQRQNQHLAG